MKFVLLPPAFNFNCIYLFMSLTVLFINVINGFLKFICDLFIHIICYKYDSLLMILTTMLGAYLL